jgi:hypothetical protein
VKEGQVFASAHHTLAAPVVKRASQFDKFPDAPLARVQKHSQACGGNATSLVFVTLAHFLFPVGYILLSSFNFFHLAVF